MRLIPHDVKFYDYFRRQTKLIAAAACLLHEGLQQGNGRIIEKLGSIKQIEHEGDDVIHEIFQRLNQTFITPLDPEDIHAVATQLDNVLDTIEDTAHRIVSYRIDVIPQPMVELSRIVLLSAKALEEAFQVIEENEPLLQRCIEVNRLEGEADTVERQAIEDLFQNEKDCIRLIKLKEIYELLEAATDRCEDVADVLQNVVVKNS